MNNINIIYEDNHLLVVEKPINIPVMQDSSNDMDLLNLLKKYIKQKYDKKGNVYLGLVHRLDRVVGGVMVFARTSKAASRLSNQVRNKTLKKTYNAVVIGKAKEKDTLIDYLVKDTKTNIVKIDKNGKESILEYNIIKYKDNLSLIQVNLITGRPHQIRVQMSHASLPLFGDQKYNKNAKVGQQIALFAKKLEFIHPTKNEEMSFEIDLPNRYPFNIF